MFSYKQFYVCALVGVLIEPIRLVKFHRMLRLLKSSLFAVHRLRVQNHKQHFYSSCTSISDDAVLFCISQ